MFKINKHEKFFENYYVVNITTIFNDKNFIFNFVFFVVFAFIFTFYNSFKNNIILNNNCFVINFTYISTNNRTFFTIYYKINYFNSNMLNV